MQGKPDAFLASYYLDSLFWYYVSIRVRYGNDIAVYMGWDNA